MCGISGILDEDQAVDSELLIRMRDTMEHRGPDDAGLYVSPDRSVGLAHRRLSIIDLSPAGHQPMSNEDNSVWVVFNGEIYNFMELRESLELKGHRFRSQCDTEVIVHLYEERGEEFPRLLDGQFAIGLWDTKTRTLLLARDRMGKKPLYYRSAGRRVQFASELKALLEDPSTPREINPVALHDYLTFQYVPCPQTIFTGIEKLPPAHTLRYRNGQTHIQPYWQLVPETSPLRMEERECEELLETRIMESVKKRLVSDVPLGVFLSGGLDSSSIVAAMRALTNGRVKTFSVGFAEEAYNELPFADRVAERFGTDHHRIVLEPSSAMDLIPKIARQFDEPLADQAAVPTYLMSQAAREHVTVCLSGEGADEILGGYPRYDLALDHQGLVQQLLVGRNDLREELDDALVPPIDRYVQSLCSFSAAEKNMLLNRDWIQLIERERTRDYPHIQTHFEAFEDLDYLTRLQYLDLQTYLPDNLLVKVDRASMLASLEVRAPFLDHDLIAFALRLPRTMKSRGGIKKYILRKIMEKKLPSQVLWRPKMGFSIPLPRWFRSDLKEYANDTLRSGNGGFFRKGAIHGLLKDPWMERPDRALKVWTLLIFEEWRRQYQV